MAREMAYTTLRKLFSHRNISSTVNTRVHSFSRMVNREYFSPSSSIRIFSREKFSTIINGIISARAYTARCSSGVSNSSLLTHGTLNRTKISSNATHSIGTAIAFVSRLSTLPFDW